MLVAKQAFMSALLNEATVTYYKDDICVFDGR
jgi:hypothetical protein